jgi:hypothetical protein
MDIADPVPRAALIGLGATVVMDLWQLALARLGQPASNFRLIGRWIGHMGRGRFVHQAIARAEPVAGEAALGWITHYAVGLAFALLLLAAVGPGWLAQPTPAPALLFGLLSVAAPFLLMQPAMGAGIAASRTPSPAANRLRSLVNHAVFGAGLYLAALLLVRVLG